ncbi:hypothetical protein [Actinocrispum sp. NPDC049592]|uniref:hypothetical protein n=1 Tax=Actinocrispum sp. NPDC049592 TaxID=3154835 RepID=UPI003415954E
MSHKRKYPSRRRTVIIVAASAGLLTSAAAAFALAQGNTPAAAQQVIVCPSPQIGAVPAAAQDGVSRELANLDKQLAEANKRLVDTTGQGGPNFVQNAILGPLADKRKASLDRIAIDIGRVGTKPQGLDRFAKCQLGNGGQPAPAPVITDPSSSAAAPAPAQGKRIVCPNPQIGAVPAAAQEGVSRELANLDKQLAEANKRLVDTAGQGGPNFVQNAILGPLADKRKSTLDRIAIDIGRVGSKPQGLDRFATCALQ